MAKKTFIRDLTAEEGWKPWDPGNTKGAWEWASNNAWDDWQNLGAERCQELLEDIVNAALRKRERDQLPEDALERMCAYLQEGREKLEGVQQTLMDAFTWAWELAYTPEDRDIEKSVERARLTINEDLRLNEYWEWLFKKTMLGPKEWNPRGLFTEAILFDHLSKRVEYKRKRNHYERYLVFDWIDSPLVNQAKKAIFAQKHGRYPDDDDINQELEEWADHFVRLMFTDLDKRMQEVDTGMRYDLGPQWKSVLSDKQRMAGVRDEILKFFRIKKAV